MQMLVIPCKRPCTFSNYNFKWGQYNFLVPGSEFENTIVFFFEINHFAFSFETERPSHEWEDNRDFKLLSAMSYVFEIKCDPMHSIIVHVSSMHVYPKKKKKCLSL